MSTKRQTTALDKLAHYRGELDQADKAKTAATKRLHEWVTKAIDAGVPTGEVARAAGLSKGRVSQLAPVARRVPARIHAQKDGAEPVRVTTTDTLPTLPDTPGPMLSGIVSQRRRTPYGRQTMFYDVTTGKAVTEQGEQVYHLAGMEPGSVAHVLYTVVHARTVLGREVGRVYLTGPLPIDRDAGATIAEEVRAWALGNPGDGWHVADAGHYLADPDLPVCRFVDAFGSQVTIMRAASWWGETEADPATCATAWRGLGRALDNVSAFAGAGLADTPATTGRALWLRTIPEGTTYPVLSDELRELIAATSGQGRIELRPEPATVGPSAFSDFTYLDGRFMYAALTWGMPIGEPRRWSGDELDQADARTWTTVLRGRSRWRITCTVPDGWAHVGMFMAPTGAGWYYPCEPGTTFDTWADGSEVWAAMERGWEPRIHEGITWAEGKPLNSWRDSLVSVWQLASRSPEPAAQLAARAVRSILLYAVGAFASRAHPVTGSTPADRPELVPDNATPGSVRRVGDVLVWERPGVVSGWSAETAHPEWSATVWARARTRLLTGRGVGQERVGALHLPVESIVGFSTDALYIAGGDPGWSDDGQPGRFRCKGTAPGEFVWPASRNELYQLRDAAEIGGNQ